MIGSVFVVPGKAQAIGFLRAFELVPEMVTERRDETPAKVGAGHALVSVRRIAGIPPI
jgi:hypothetical protein